MLMINQKFADAMPDDPNTVELTRFRCEHFLVLMAKTQKFLSVIREYPGRVALEYQRPTHPEISWTKWVLDSYGGGYQYTGMPSHAASNPEYRAKYAAACARWVADVKLDGLSLDTPFECEKPLDAVKLCLEIQTALYPRITCVNFGDQFTWQMGLDTPGGQMAQGMRWHLVEVGVDMRKFSPQNLNKAVSSLGKFLDMGKTVVFGIYDPMRDNQHLAAAIANSLLHDSLFIKYHSGGTSAEHWNPLFTQPLFT